MLLDGDPPPTDPHRVLGVKPGSPVEVITAAYERLRRTYAADGLAGYSLISNAEREAHLRAIEKAYVALTGGTRRPAPPVAAPTRLPVAPARPLAAPTRRHIFVESALEEAAERPSAPPRPVTSLACDGATLKQMRIQQGWSTAELAGRTKIQRSYIEALEEENVSRLPAQVYLKGYLRTLLQELGADNPAGMTEGYVARLVAAPPVESSKRRWGLFKR